MSNITYALTEFYDDSGRVNEWAVKVTDWDGYPESSVLAGQPIVKWEGSYETKEEALAAYPEALVWE